MPVLTELINGFPFVVNGCHADHGSEYVNRQVAKPLHKLQVGEFTKSRPRRFAGTVNAFTRGKLKAPERSVHRRRTSPSWATEATNSPAWL